MAPPLHGCHHHPPDSKRLECKANLTYESAHLLAELAVNCEFTTCKHQEWLHQAHMAVASQQEEKLP